MSAHIDQLRQRYPEMSSGYFDLLEREAALQHKLSELEARVAHLAGWYDARARHFGNEDLAALVTELRQAIGLPAD